MKDDIRARIDIVDYIGTYVRLTKRGKNYLGLCPFHSEKTPSFNVMRERGIYKCFGCGEGGNIFSFVMKMENLTFREALERLAEKTGVQLDTKRSGPSADKKERARAMHTEAGRFYAERCWNTPAALEYARNRHITDESLRQFGLGWAPEEWESLITHLRRLGWSDREVAEAGLATTKDGASYYDRFRGRLMFPIFDLQDRVIAFGGRIVGEGEPKYLNSPESGLFSKSRTLYALNLAHKAIAEQNRALVMEGYMDVLAAHQAGFPIAVATLGTSLTSEHVHLLSRYTKNIILSFDADSAGVRAALRAGPMFEEADMDVRLLVLPAGHDPDTFLRDFGAAAFTERLNKAVPLVDFQLDRLVLEHNLESDEGRTAFVRAALPVLSTIRSNISRDQYIRRLAETWARNDLSRVGYREEEIRRELSSMGRRALADLRAQRARSVSQSVTPSLTEMAANPLDSSATAAPSGVQIAERTVLRALLQNPELVRPLHLKSEDFSEGWHRELAVIALQGLEAGSTGDLLDDVTSMPEPLTRLITELHLLNEPPICAASVQDAVDRLCALARQRRLRELKDSMEQHLESLRENGINPSDDPLFQEWMELQRQPRVSDRSRVA